jgi:hypothetical protein
VLAACPMHDRAFAGVLAIISVHISLPIVVSLTELLCGRCP